MNNILIIAPERDSIKRLRSRLKEKEYNVSIAVSADAAFDVLRKQLPGIVIIDFTTPEIDGIVTYRKLRKDKNMAGIPILAVITEDQIQELDLVRGLDDFVVEPSGMAEVPARVKNIFWRISNINSDNLFKLGDLVIDLARYEVSIAGRKANLTYKEFELLKFLATNPSRVLSRDVLLNKIWGYDFYGGTRTVDVHVRRLRSKIEDRKHIFIETVRNVGYKFVEK